MEIKQCREEISHIDEELTRLFVRRMNFSREIAIEKKKESLPICYPEQEIIVKNRFLNLVPEDMRDSYQDFISSLLEVSKKYQSEFLIEEKKNDRD